MAQSTRQFIDTIEDVQGIISLRSYYEDGFHIRVYESLYGTPVFIDTTEDEMEDETQAKYLNQLGLLHLIPVLCPELTAINSKELN